MQNVGVRTLPKTSAVKSLAPKFSRNFLETFMVQIGPNLEVLAPNRVLPPAERFGFVSRYVTNYVTLSYVTHFVCWM